MKQVPRFGRIARQRQSAFRASLSPAAQSPTDDKGKRNDHLLTVGHELENLYPDLRGPNGALPFFGERKIKWWTNARSGDRPVGNGFEGPTRNLASSQVSCVNFLLPLVEVPEALVAFLRCLDSDVTGVEPIIDQGRRTSLVEFEWVGWDRPLEGGNITRGANQTSVDAFLVARTSAGRRAYLIEWKYCEEYRNPEYKGDGQSGITRRARYAQLFSHERSSFSQVALLDDFFYEPYYQIMRLLLLRDRMMAEGVSPDMPIEDARVVVVCPAANTDYRRAVKETPLGRQFPSLGTVEDIVQATLKTPQSFATLAQEDVVAALRGGPNAKRLMPWLDYHQLRYGW